MIHYVDVSGSDVQRVVDKIQAACAAETVDATIMGCLALAIWLQNQEMETEDLVEAVKGVSEWISCYVTDPDNKCEVVN